ncbi:hypothetical protein KSS87_008090 [Heliosperma pusillum]|nr:hypothetical protein KSS87_008090 [Heliosperma pusillum]
MASKTKSGLFQTPVSKSSSTTSRTKLGSSASLKSDADSVSSTNSRFSFDRGSPRPVTSSRPVSRSSPRVSTSDKPQPRINKPSELQAQLQAAQDDLKKAKEKLALSEKEKGQALNDLKEAKKIADEANEKLQQALVAQKRAEESSEIENFRAVELEQAAIDASQKKEEEWKKELESLRSQLLSDDKASFVNAKEELQKVKQELALVIETKNQALAHADDATKIAEVHAEKVEFLSSELVRLKDLLESKVKDETFENGMVVELRQELEKAKSFEQELIEKEKSYEKNLVDMKSEIESLREELNKAMACQEDLVQKEKSYEKIVSDMTVELASRDQDLEKAKICEKSYEKTIEELKSKLDSLHQDLEKAKASEQDLADREKTHDIIVTELKSEIDFVKQELEKTQMLEVKLAEKEASYEQTVTELEEGKSMVEEMIEREKLTEEIMREMELELHSLKQELQVSKGFQERLTQMEDSYELMNVELEAARMAESYALNSLDEWKRRSEELEHKLVETTRLERSASESLESVMKQLEGNSDVLHKAECEVDALKEKVSLLEISLKNRKEDLEGSESRVRKAKEEVNEAAMVIESMRSELETMKEEKAQSLEHERLAASSVQDLLEEKNTLLNEVQRLKKEEENSKMAMESLACALHEVSSEAREAKERLVSSQAEHENFETQIEHLQLVVKGTSEKYEAMLGDSRREIDRLTSTVDQSKLELDVQMEDLKVVLKASNDKYESMLDQAKQEIDHLTETLEKSKLEHENKKTEWEAKEMRITEKLESSYEESKAEWEQKEIQLVNGLKRSEEEKSSLEKEIMRLVNLLREAEEKAEESGSLKEALEKADTNCLELKETLHFKENKVENITRENEKLRAAEDANALKIDELTKLLEEAKSRYQSNENGGISDSDKDYDLLPKVVGFSEENGPHREKELHTFLKGIVYPEEVHGKSMIPENKEEVKVEIPESEGKMWESYKVDREFSTEEGSLDDEVESKPDNAESPDLNKNPSENGSNSDSKQQKKKKPLYRKFGNLLKKGISNPK